MRMIRGDTTIKDLDEIAVSNWARFEIILTDFLKGCYINFLNKLAEEIYCLYGIELDNFDIVLYYILKERDENNMNITYDFLYKYDRYEILNLLFARLINKENSTFVRKYLIEHDLKNNNLDNVLYLIEGLKDEDLFLISDRDLLRIATKTDVINKLFNNIETIDDIYDMNIDELVGIFNKAFDYILEKDLDVDKLYKYNLNLISLCLFSENLDLLNKVINMCRLSLIEIDEKIIKDVVVDNKYLNLTKHLQIMSSLENFDDFIKTNWFLLTKISDRETVEYLRNISD